MYYMEKKFYVYVHRRNDTGCVFYVGKGCGNRYKSIHSRNKWWNNIASKHGFTYEIIKNGLSEKCAYTFEKITIFLLRKSGEKLVNTSDGGEGNPGELPMNRKPVVCSNGMQFPSVGHAAKWAGVSESKISSACIGKRHSCAGFTWAYDGNIVPEYISPSERLSKHKRKSVCCSNGMVFDSGKSAAEWLLSRGVNASPANISCACNGKIGSAYGFSWWFYGNMPVEYVDRYKRSSNTLKAKSK